MSCPSGQLEEDEFSGPESPDPSILAFLFLRPATPGPLIQPGDQASLTRIIKLFFLGPRNLGNEHTRLGFSHAWS